MAAPAENSGGADEEKKSKKKKKDGGGGKEKKAFAKPGALARSVKIAAERDERRAKNPAAPVERYGSDAAPKVVAVVGPRRSGKSTIIRSLVRHYTKRRITEVLGPMTMVSGRKRRLTLIEVSDDLPSIIDAAKVADLIICVIDAHFGFEMETFEMLNIAMTHGMPSVMGVLTNLDKFREGKQVSKVKKQLKARFWTELYDGAKLFYFSGLTTSQEYLGREVLNLARFISVTKYRLVRWRSEHPYVLADRVEDMTDPTAPKTSNRTVAAFGYVRGTSIRVANGRWFVHVAGLGDLEARRVDVLPDPCPPPEGGYEHAAATKKKKLSDRDRVLYAPMSGELDGIAYDKDAVYINIPDESVRFSRKEGEDADPEFGEDGKSAGEGERMVKDLQNVPLGIDELSKRKEMRILADGVAVKSEGFQNVSRRLFSDDDSEGTGESDEDEGDEDSEEDEEDGEGDSRYLSEDDGSDVDEDDEDDEDSEDAVEDAGSGEAQDEEESEEDDDVNGAEEDTAQMKWKELRMRRSRKSNVRTKTLAKYIYGPVDRETEAGEDSSEEGDEDEEDTDLLKKKENAVEDDDEEDSSHMRFPTASWVEDEEACAELRHRRFATGAAARLAGGPDDVGLGDGDQVYGDFEDIETGEKFGPNAAKSESSGSEGDDDDLDEEELRRKRELTKQNFDEEYENRGKANGDDEEDQATTIDAERKELQLRRENLLSNLDEEAKQKLEGILPGRYVRVELDDVPVEFIQHFNPKYPVILGGLRRGDEKKMLIRTRLKRHRWKRGLLKSHDPLIVSIGWRRYQTQPVYSIEDQTKRHRFLKYTPEHMHCSATFWGYTAPPSSGVVACQSLGRAFKGFRVSAMGLVTEVDVHFSIMKKLKLVGEPFVVHKNTAFIKNMFNSELEVNKFVGASVRTVSGIRGTIKKALRASGGDKTTGPPGSFRGTFEDKLLRSDLVFLRAWVPVEPREFCSVASTLLEAKHGSRSETSSWRMRTTRELREQNQLPIPSQKDSLYKPIEREVRRFNPLKIPNKLERELPYASRPKVMDKKKKKRVDKDRALVMEPEERQEYKMMQMVSTLKNDRIQKRKEAAKERLSRKRKEAAKDEEKHQMGEKKRRKERYIKEGMRKKREDAKKAAAEP